MRISDWSSDVCSSDLAGPILVAVGAEYRTNASKGNNDPNSKLGLFSQQAWTFLPATTQKVTEVYGELNVPLFTDSPLGKSLEVDGAVRQTHYSISGNATTWKEIGRAPSEHQSLMR